MSHTKSSEADAAIRAGASPLDLAERLKDVWNRLPESERGPDLLVIIDELSALSTASPLRLEPIKRRVERNYGGGEAWRTSGEMKDVIALLAEVEALRQRLLAAPQWLPIETAPTDGTQVLLGWPTMVLSGYKADWRGHKPWITSRGDYMGTNSPTHWMPLPSPPALLPDEMPEEEKNDDEDFTRVDRQCP